MEIWNMWITLIESSVVFFSSRVGMSEAMSIITFTLIARIILLPVSFKSAYSMYKNKLAMNKLMPEIARLKNRYKDDPNEIAKRTLLLYKKNGIKFIDRTSLLNLGTQGVLGVGIFQALKEMVFNSKFIWIANIARPDIALAFFVGALTFLSMVLMPGVAEQSTWLIIAIPALVSIFVLASFPSAIGIYWAASNVVTLGQTLLLRYIISIEQGSTSKI